MDPAGSVPKVKQGLDWVQRPDLVLKQSLGLDSAQDQRLETDLAPEWFLELDLAQEQKLELDFGPKWILELDLA